MTEFLCGKSDMVVGEKCQSPDLEGNIYQSRRLSLSYKFVHEESVAALFPKFDENLVAVPQSWPRLVPVVTEKSGKTIFFARVAHLMKKALGTDIWVEKVKAASIPEVVTSTTGAVEGLAKLLGLTSALELNFLFKGRYRLVLFVDALDTISDREQRQVAVSWLCDWLIHGIAQVWVNGRDHVKQDIVQVLTSTMLDIQLRSPTCFYNLEPLTDRQWISYLKERWTELEDLDGRNPMEWLERRRVINEAIRHVHLTHAPNEVRLTFKNDVRASTLRWVPTAASLARRPKRRRREDRPRPSMEKRKGGHRQKSAKTSSADQAGQVTPTAAATLRRPGDDAQLAACASDEPSFPAPYVVNRTCMVNYSKLTSETPKYYFRNEFYCLFSSLKCHQFFISTNFVPQLFYFKVPPIHKLREKGKTRHPRTARGPGEKKSERGTNGKRASLDIFAELLLSEGKLRWRGGAGGFNQGDSTSCNPT